MPAREPDAFTPQSRVRVNITERRRNSCRARALLPFVIA